MNNHNYSAKVSFVVLCSAYQISLLKMAICLHVSCDFKFLLQLQAEEHNFTHNIQ